MADLKNEFSWSWSRHRAFESCLRRYYLQHYAFWGGWDPSSPAREIYIQKRLNSRPQWIGLTVHEAAEWLLKQVRRGEFPTRERAVERFMRQARRRIEESERGLYRQRPKKSPGFVDHYYDLGTAPDVWEADLAEIERQVDGLFDNDVFLRLSRVPERIVEIEELQQMRVGDVPVWVSLDVLVGDGEGGFVVIDWKTGREHNPETVAKQLGVYGAYVLDRYFGQAPGDPGELALNRVRAMYVNTRENSYETRDLTKEMLDSTVATVRDSAALMRTKLVDVSQNVAQEGDFPMVEEDSAECRRCHFRRQCGRE
ncbi:MAG: PD-(D/E)XK nuclease family protein [Myxococcota bacterium]